MTCNVLRKDLHLQINIILMLYYYNYYNTPNKTKTRRLTFTGIVIKVCNMLGMWAWFQGKSNVSDQVLEVGVVVKLFHVVCQDLVGKLKLTLHTHIHTMYIYTHIHTMYIYTHYYNTEGSIMANTIYCFDCWQAWQICSMHHVMITPEAVVGLQFMNITVDV